MIRAFVLGSCLVAAGCFSPRYGSGQFACGSGAHACPDGYYCATDNRCWAVGSGPGDLGTGDVDMGDMAAPILMYPPAAVWISAGGGSLQQPGVADIQTTISGEFAVGSGSTAASPSPTINLGYFSSATK